MLDKFQLRYSEYFCRVNYARYRSTYVLKIGESASHAWDDLVILVNDNPYIVNVY